MGPQEVTCVPGGRYPRAPRPANGTLVRPLPEATLPTDTPIAPTEPPSPPTRTIVLVGLMGAGKTSVGKRLAARLGLPFRDADNEIEAAAGCTVAEIFERYGEPEFRAGERKVIARLLQEEPPHVLATGGGAFMDPGTRRLVGLHGISVWLRAELDVLVRRTARRSHRPLLNQGSPRDVLARLIELRHPVYAEADVVVDSEDAPPEAMVERVVEALRRHTERERVNAP